MSYIQQQIKLLNSTGSCFTSMSTRFSEQGIKNKRSFHDSIKADKKIIYNFFEKEPSYRDLMSIISKSNKDSAYYYKFIKNNSYNNINSRNDKKKPSPFLASILKILNKSGDKKENKKKEEKKVLKNLYRIPKIELLRRKKEKIGIYLKKKNKTLNNLNNAEVKLKTLTKSKSMLNKVKLNNFQENNKEESTNSNTYKININNFYTINNTNKNNKNNLTNTSNVNDAIFSLDTLQTFNPNNEISTLNNNNLKELSNLSNFNLTKVSLVAQPKRVYDSPKKISRQSVSITENLKLQEKFNFEKTKRMNKILDKCEERLIDAKNVETDFKKISKEKSPFDIQNKFRNALQSDDQKVIEGIDKGIKRLQAYKKIQNEKFISLKKNLDIKISDEYAHLVRKKLIENFGINGTVLIYELYSNDILKDRAKVEKNLQNEKRTINKVKDLLDDVYRKKEFLKYKIDNYNAKHENIDKFNEYNNKNKNIIEQKDFNGGILKGNLLPKLIEAREQCFSGTIYDFNKM